MAISLDPQVMGVLNITPDSFSDGGILYREGVSSISAVLIAAEKMVSEGADWLDVGGESTRPGAISVEVTEELDRVIPVIEALKSNFPTKISIDTSRAPVMRAAAIAGASMINDVRALTEEDALETAKTTGLDVCLMHMKGTPESMQDKPEYSSVVDEVSDFLSSRLFACVNAGVAKEKICLDPGFGFGKTVDHNLQLIGGLSKLRELGCPILFGASRKSTIGTILDRGPTERLTGTSVLNLLALQSGASIIRVHDVDAARDVVLMLRAYNEALAKLKHKVR